MKIYLPDYEPGADELEHLKAYNPLKYPRPSFTVDILVFTAGKKANTDIRKVPEYLPRLLLIKRNNYPYKDSYALPGGFVDMDESLEDAALRELKEETGLEKVGIQQLYTIGGLNRDPRYRTVSTAYICFEKESELNITPGDDAGEALLFDIHISKNHLKTSYASKGLDITNQWEIHFSNGVIDLKTIIIQEMSTNYGVVSNNFKIKYSDLAFDHGAIVLYGLLEMQKMIDSTDIIFNFMEDTFTLTELQRVYEGIKLKKESKANFRRKFYDRVMPTQSIKKGTGFRPPTLYSYNPKCCIISKGDL